MRASVDSASSSSAISSHPGNSGARLTTKTSAILTSCAGGAIYGLAAGIIGGISDPLIKNRFFSDSDKQTQSLMSGILTACILLGAFFGTFLGVDWGNRFGRRTSFKLTGLICVSMSVLLACVPNFALIVLVRTVLGLSIGLATALCPWYVTDAVPPSTRGSIGTIFQINICGFILVSELINYAFHPDASDTNLYEADWKWKTQFSISALPGLFMFFLGFIMHESPVYLQALDERRPLYSEVLPDHRMDTFAAEPGLDTSQSPSAASSNAGLAVEKQGWADLFSAKNIRWVFVGLILSASNQLTGINAIIFYAPKIFTDAGMSNPLVLTFAVVGTWNLLSVFISFALVDRLGRRPLMLGALFFMLLGSGLMSLAYAAFSEHKAAPAILAMILFIGAFECGPGPLFFLMATFPAPLQDVALSFTQSSCWIFSICVTFGFPVINDALGPAATFLIFCCNCAVGFVLIWAYVPEPQKGPEVGVDGITEGEDGTRVNASPYERL